MGICLLDDNEDEMFGWFELSDTYTEHTFLGQLVDTC